eukprot:5866778-Amphidinium_carterae.1
MCRLVSQRVNLDIGGGAAQGVTSAQGLSRRAEQATSSWPQLTRILCQSLLMWSDQATCLHSMDVSPDHRLHNDETVQQETRVSEFRNIERRVAIARAVLKDEEARDLVLDTGPCKMTSNPDVIGWHTACCA